ncbi:GH92 family glycosyl hydrolase [Telmatobacter bradus]|uniref:GH92 family glycosyl hydrolase n=1 Tax=Telmatobacter bradus TaxID=474953 RepID=UPI003B42D082
MKTHFFKCALLLAIIYSRQIVAQEPVGWVNERIGTANDGQTFPATGMPFAMTQWTPQTRDGQSKCIAPYYDGDRRIQGFRGSHFMSGSCTQDYGSVTLMPVSGSLHLEATKRASAFDHKGEELTPFLYKVRLDDYGIQAEVSGTLHAGILRFTYERGGKSWVVMQENGQEGDIRVDPTRNEVLISSPVRRIYAGSGKPAGFDGYAVIRFDRPFQLGGVWKGTQRSAGKLATEPGLAQAGTWVSFDLHPGEKVVAKVGTSFTSLEEARQNLDTEIPDWDMDRVLRQVRQAWNEQLGRFRIQSEPTQKTIFYTALYHSFLLPRVFSDTDGSYPGFAGTKKIEHATGFTYYNDYSIWDTFRALHPLITLIDPVRETDMVRSLLAMGEQGGYLPIYPAWNSYTSEMIGDHSVAIIVDAWMKGLHNFDAEEAYRLMRKNAVELPASRELYMDGRGRRGLDSYLKYGYIPLEDTIADAYHPNEQVSRTLEYAYDDDLLGQFAAELGHTADAKLFAARGQNYRKVIDPVTGFARGRYADGRWVEPFNPAEKASYITEGLPYQYTFFVPQDIPGLVDVLGGKTRFAEKLDQLFASGYYDHGNEPSHHLAYLYDFVGESWKTQQQVRSILEREYSNSPSGLAGNDDCGQISAWYVFSALGFYPVSPGIPRYQIGSPLFEDAVLELPNGKTLHIVARGAASGKKYIRSVTWNGAVLDHAWITHEQISQGGELVFTLADHPNMNWPSQ